MYSKLAGRTVSNTGAVVFKRGMATGKDIAFGVGSLIIDPYAYAYSHDPSCHAYITAHYPITHAHACIPYLTLY